MSKVSLASKSKAVVPVESNPGTGLPVGFEGGGMAVSAPVFQRTPYVLFVSTKGQTFARLAPQIPGLQDGDPVLVRDEKGLKLNPFKFYLIDAFQHFSVVDNQGAIVKSMFDVERAREDKINKWNEHIEAVILVVDGDTLTPARCTFKTTKTAAAHAAVSAAKVAADAEAWGALSAEHKTSLAVPTHWARYITTATLKRGTSKGGFAFVAANGFVTPTGLSDWNLLSEAFKDDSFRKLCEAVGDRHRERVEEIKSKAA